MADISGLELLYLSGTAALAGFTQGLSGFGAVLVGLPLAALYLDLPTAVPLLNLLGLVINLALIFKLHRCCRWGLVLWLVLASLPGIALGVWLLTLAVTPLLEALLGLTLVAAVLPPRGVTNLPVQATRPLVTVCVGLIAGFLGGSLAANGPPVILYAGWQPWTKDEIKATLVGYFLCAGILVGSGQVGAGLLTPKVIQLAVAALPALLLGVGLGSWVYGRLATSGYRRLLQWALALLGLLFLWRSGRYWLA